MHSRTILTVIISTIILWMTISCSGNPNQLPVSPPSFEKTPPPDNTGRNTANQSHRLWGYYLIQIDPGSDSASILPVRDIADHWNVRKFLENGPCFDCLKVTGITPAPDGSAKFDVEITHPFPSANLTGFDVRGIAMFNGSHTFPESGLTAPDSSDGDGELLNADGYTTLYNSGTVGSGPGGLQGYSKGKFASITMPGADLNGFKRFITDDPANTRNAFYAGDAITETYELIMPVSGFVFGYAIDASWVPATVKPVVDPMTDFPPEANCPEPWRVDVFVAPTGPGLQPGGGEVTLTANIYDYQGTDSHSAPSIECPELFFGAKTMNWVSDSAGFSTWELAVSNEKSAPLGPNKCLVRVIDNENAGSPPYLDLTAYQIVTLRVGAGNLVWVEAGGGPAFDEAKGIASYEDDSVVITGDFAGSATFGGGEPNEVTLDSAGQIDIFVARYNPDGTLAWARSAGGPGYDEGVAVTVLSDNSVVVTGEFQDTAIFGLGDPMEASLVSKGGYDIFVARYLPNGTISWARSGGGAAWDGGYGIDVLSDDSVVITGYFGGSAVFGDSEPNETTLISEGEDDIFIARFGFDGSLMWAKSQGGTYYDSGYGISALPDDSTVAIGYFMNTATFGQGDPNQTELVAVGEEDLYIAHYNPDGSIDWAKPAGGTGSEGCFGIAPLDDNSVVVTGMFGGTATFGEGEPGEVTLTATGNNEMFIAHYNPDGTLAWAKRAGGSGSDRGEGVAVLSDSTTVVTGVYTDSATFGEGEQNEVTLTTTLSSMNEIFNARYDLNGMLLWAKSEGGNDDDEGNGIVSLSDDSFVITGYFNDGATFGAGESEQLTIIGAGESDAFVARFLP